MPNASFRPILFFFFVCLLTAACGGDGGNRTITTSTPTSPTPGTSVDACDAIEATGGASVAIVNGSSCSTSRSTVVLLNARDQNGNAVGACSGTVIGRRSILTAAHCLDGDTAIVRVWFGSGSEITADSFVMHPTYISNPNTGLDLGIVRMAEDLPRLPVAVLTGRDARVGETAVIAGWGRDQDSIPATLRAGSTTISAVNAVYLETMFSAGAASICSGDSGGPLLLSEGNRWAIAGVSAAVTVAQCNAGISFYVNVRHSNATPFIKDQVPDLIER